MQYQYQYQSVALFTLSICQTLALIPGSDHAFALVSDHTRDGHDG